MKGMKPICSLLCILTAVISLTACAAGQTGGVGGPGHGSGNEKGTEESAAWEPEASESGNRALEETASEESDAMRMNVQAGGRRFTATLENNPAADSFVQMMEKEPVVIQMRDYSGFEKVGSLGISLPASNREITAGSGDIVLYNGSQIVIFYGSNSWSYTRLGKIDDLSGWTEALGSGDVTVTFSLER
ncbi:MAG: hypothetical protein LIP16_00315 [Clostridium sp.]|nr:hypothetical protein [Clostridium sp.]